MGPRVFRGFGLVDLARGAAAQGAAPGVAARRGRLVGRVVVVLELVVFEYVARESWVIDEFFVVVYGKQCSGDSLWRSDALVLWLNDFEVYSLKSVFLLE